MYILLLLFSIISILKAQSFAQLRELALSKGLKLIPLSCDNLLFMVDNQNNLMSIEKIHLGKKLFFDKNLSKDGTLSCASCHDITQGGKDGKPTAIGYQNLENPNHLNSPTVLNTAFSQHLFLDGRMSSLREQAKGPTLAAFEMAATPELIEQRVKKNTEYQRLFKESFTEDNPIIFDNITKAIAVYDKTLVTRGAFDAFLEGEDSALSTSAQNRLNLFINLGCKGCHFGVEFTSEQLDSMESFLKSLGGEIVYYKLDFE